MRIACRIPNATKTHSENAILIALPLQQWLHQHTSRLRYMFIAYLVLGEQSLIFILSNSVLPTAIHKPAL
jgi:hypothetical protein